MPVSIKELRPNTNAFGFDATHPLCRDEGRRWLRRKTRAGGWLGCRAASDLSSFEEFGGVNQVHQLKETPNAANC